MMSAITRTDSALLLGGLRVTATRLINEHVSARGCRASCGRAWPRTIACRAGFTLGM